MKRVIMIRLKDNGKNILSNESKLERFSTREQAEHYLIDNDLYDMFLHGHIEIVE